MFFPSQKRNAFQARLQDPMRSLAEPAPGKRFNRPGSVRVSLVSGVFPAPLSANVLGVHEPAALAQ